LIELRLSGRRCSRVEPAASDPCIACGTCICSARLNVLQRDGKDYPWSIPPTVRPSSGMPPALRYRAADRWFCIGTRSADHHKRARGARFSYRVDASATVTQVTLPLRTTCDSRCRARSDYCLAVAKEASPGSRPRLLVLVLSSDAISADAGYRSPRESKRRGPAIGEEQGLK
jgi:hypothetical protein